jgi:hypothetical protein
MISPVFEIAQLEKGLGLTWSAFVVKSKGIAHKPGTGSGSV